MDQENMADYFQGTSEYGTPPPWNDPMNCKCFRVPKIVIEVEVGDSLSM